MINEVYNLVQELLDKNGYGVLSPVRFMLFAQNSQVKLLMNAIEKTRKDRLKSKTQFDDTSLKVMESIMEVFTESYRPSRYFNGSLHEYHSIPDDFMIWGEASLDHSNTVIEKIESSKKSSILRNGILKPTVDVPYCYIEGSKLYILPDSIGVINNEGSDEVFDEVSMTYIRYPKNPVWTYYLVDGEPYFNESDSNYQDFELPLSLKDALVVDILAQAGLHIRDEYVSSMAQTEANVEYNKDNN